MISHKEINPYGFLLKDTIIEEVKVIDVCENIKTGFIEEEGNIYYYENNKKFGISKIKRRKRNFS